MHLKLLHGDSINKEEGILRDVVYQINDCYHKEQKEEQSELQQEILEANKKGFLTFGERIKFTITKAQLSPRAKTKNIIIGR